MNRHDHILLAAGGTLLWTHLVGLTHPGVVVASLLLAAGATCIPDIDQRWDLPERRRYWAHGEWRLESPCRPMLHAREHRGALHAPMVAFVAGMAVSVVCDLLLGQSWPGWAFGLGWLLHIAADAGSWMGVPMLWPFSRNRYRLGRGMASGGRTDLDVALVLVGIGLLSVLL